MLFVGIDQHKRHLTVCIRSEQGCVVQRRQVSTQWQDVKRFLDSLQERSSVHGGYVAVMEVCGFNGWLIKRLRQWDCTRVYVIAAPPRLTQKTDRRDAAKLSELLWLNRDRIAADQPLIHMTEVHQTTDDEQHDRQLTRLRQRLGQDLTRIKNSIKGILRRHNLEQNCPTKGMFTQRSLRWLQLVELPEMDRIEMTMRLNQFALYKRQINEAEALIAKRAEQNPRVELLRTVPKMGAYTALAVASHIGPMERFVRARSLSNFFGLTPGCRNSGATDRPGSITKAGHPFVRFLLGQMVLHALRGDRGLRTWYHQVKNRRGSKVARVAVMRRLCEAIWHVLHDGRPYVLVENMPPRDGGKTRRRRAAERRMSAA